MTSQLDVELWVGQLIDLQTEDGNIYQSQIVAKDKNNSLLFIQRPFSIQNHIMPIRDHEKVIIYFHDHALGLCMFSSRLHSKAHRLWIQAPSLGMLQKAQRRKYLRVPINCEMVITLEDEDKQAVSIPCTTKDISGGGLSLLCAAKVEPGRIINGIVQLTASRSIPFTAHVVYCSKLGDDQYKISLEFLQMKESLRSEIVKYCLQKQIEMRNKLKNFPI